MSNDQWVLRREERWKFSLHLTDGLLEAGWELVEDIIEAGITVVQKF